jgi:hypothetical protein
MNSTPQPAKRDSRFFGTASVIAPLIGLGMLVLIVCFFVFTAHDSEGQLWGQVIGYFLGGSILIVSTIIGLCFAFVSRRSEKRPLIFWTGLILNIILLSLILYILIPVALRFIR